MPIWVIEVEGSWRSSDRFFENPQTRHYSYAMGTVDARSGEILSQSYYSEPLFGMVPWQGRSAGIPSGRGHPGLQDEPGSTGWKCKLLDQEGSGDQVSMMVHHVITTHLGIYAVYSVKAKGPSAHLNLATVAKRITDGAMIADSTSDHLVGTSSRTSVRIAKFGKPGSMGIRLMTNPDPEAAYLLGGGYWVFGPEGVTFGVLPRGVIPTDDTPTYFMISPDGAIREITFEELVAFNEKHRR